MEPLKTEFIQGPYDYTQVMREGNLAIFRQQHREHPEVVRFEVVRIRINRAHTWPNGLTTPEKEAYPGSNAWGTDGWTYLTLDEAEKLFQSLKSLEG